MKTIGKFEILRTVGHGAMGVVYFAKDPAIGREGFQRHGLVGRFRSGRFKTMLEKDQKIKRLPVELREKLLKGEL